MDISAIPGVTSLQQPSQTELTQRRQNFDSLAKALQTGDLSAAQQAYAKIQQNAPPPPPTGTDTNNQASTHGSNAKAQFDALGKALQSGDLAAAQKAFANIQAGMKAHGHHHHHAAGSSTQQTNTNQATSPATGTSDVDGDKDGSKLNVAA